jgi:hypothetical protein
MPAITKNYILAVFSIKFMNLCHNCGTKLTLGSEKFCPDCGTELQQQMGKVGINNQSVDVQQTGGDVLGAGVPGSGNIVAKDTKGNIYNFHNNFYGFSAEQLKNIITASTTLYVSQSSDNKIREVQDLTEIKQKTAQVIQEVNKVQKEEGREIQEIKVGEVQISKNELQLKELMLKGIC